MTVYSIGDKTPSIAPDAWVAPDASVIGDVQLAAKSSVWFGAAIRAENDRVVIGEGCNIQDGSVIHIDPGYPLTLHRHVTVGHKVMLHGCTVQEQSLIGIGSILLNGSVIGRNSLVGANTLIPEGKEYPEGVLILGSPGKVVRKLTDEEQQGLLRAAEHYISNAEYFSKNLKAIS